MKHLSARKGFTLIELMIAVAIIGILAAVAGNAFYKNILKSRTAGAPILIRTFYDAETVFASKGEMSIRDATHGDVTCKPSPRFAPVCLHRVNNDDTSYTAHLPGSVKRTLVYYTNANDSFTYEPSTNTCTFSSISSVRLDPKYLGFEGELAGGGSYRHMKLPIKSYYTLRAQRSATLENEFGVPRENTLMIAALGDVDGDHPLDAPNMGCAPFETYAGSSDTIYKNMSIFARGMHIDSNGDIQGSAGLIKINELE